MAANIAVGVHEKRNPADTMNEFPGARWGREFVAKKDGGALPASTSARQLIALVRAKVDPWLRAGGGCMVSIKLDPRQLAAGVWSPKLTALGADLAGLDVIVILWHEPEDNWPAAVFKPGFETGRAALKAGGPDMCVALCSIAYQWRPGPGTATAKDFAVWASIEADLYLVDVYSGKSFPKDAILSEHPGWIRWYALMISPVPGRAWGVAERGWLATDVRPATIHREADWLAASPIGQTCRVYNVWGTGGTEGEPGWLLHDAPSAAEVTRLLALITVPAGYERGPAGGLLIHQATGVLVAAHLAAAHTAWLTQIGDPR